MHDGGDGHLTQPLDLGNDCLAVVQLEAVLQPHLLPGPEHGGGLQVTPLLRRGVEREVEQRPGQGGGGGVAPRPEQVEAEHRQLRRGELGPGRAPHLGEEGVHEVPGAVLLQLRAVRRDQIPEVVPHLGEDPEAAAVVGEAGQHEPHPGEHERHDQDLAGEDEGQVLQD